MSEYVHDANLTDRDFARALREAAASTRDAKERLYLYQAANDIERQIDARLREEQ